MEGMKLVGFILLNVYLVECQTPLTLIELTSTVISSSTAAGPSTGKCELQPMFKL